jgi:hypothetical protein
MGPHRRCLPGPGSVSGPPRRPWYDSEAMEQIGLFIVGFFYLAISVGAIYGLFSRRDQLPKRR